MTSEKASRRRTSQSQVQSRHLLGSCVRGPAEAQRLQQGCTQSIDAGDADVTEDSAELLRRYVHTALVGKAKGTQTSTYARFVKEVAQLRRTVETPEHDVAADYNLSCLLQALTSCVSALRERKHDALLSEVLSFKLWKVSQVVRAAVLDLMTNMMAANSAFVQSCLQVLLFSMLPPPAPPAPVDAAQLGTAWQPSEQAVEVQGQVLGAMEKAMQLVPTLPSTLLGMLVANMPHKLRDRDTQCLYLRGAFLLAEGPCGAPLREGLLLGVVDHLLSVDVEIRWEDIVDVHTGQEHEEGESEEEQEDIFELDEGMNELDISRDGGAAQPAGHPAQPAQRGGWEGAATAAAGRAAGADAAADRTAGDASVSGRPPVDESADKLDAMMELVFQHLGRRCDAGQLPQVWSTLLAAFERTVLHTHRSKFTQFLLFYVARRDPQRCCQGFAKTLLNRLRDARQPPITRSACAAYLASFLARSAFAPEWLVVETLQQLADACAEYASSSGALTRNSSGSSSSASGGFGANGAGMFGLQYGAPGSSTGDAQGMPRHQVFYAMVRALLYVLCYHMEPLVRQQRQQQQEQQDHEQQGRDSAPALAKAVAALVRKRVVPLLQHQLAPLHSCLPSVAAEFARQVLVLELADVRPLLPTAASDGTAAAQQAAAAVAAAAAGGPVPPRPLDMFFPFDPYLLHRSSRFLDLEHSYVRWRHGHPEAAAPGAVADGPGVALGSGAAYCMDEQGDDESEGHPGDSGDLEGTNVTSDDESDESDSDSSSESDTELEENDDAGMQGASPHLHSTAPAATAAAAVAARKLHAAASIGTRQRPLPVGLVAAAQRAAMVGGASPPDMMATSLLASAAYMAAGGSYSPSPGTQGPYGASPMQLGHISPVLGASPMAMSLEVYEGAAYMHASAAHRR